ncbi:MAG: PAS domain-containing protein [Thermodesulfobacteriota bacterium]
MADRYTRKPGPSGGATHVPAAILPVVLIYAVFAALWIIFSDKAVEQLFDDPARIILASTLKGWLFVIVTSVLLYGLMRRLVIGQAGTRDVSPGGLHPLLLPMALLIAAIALMTGGAISHTIIDQKGREAAVLQTVVDLKTRQVTDWLGERYADARFVQLSSPWIDLYRHWRSTGDAASLAQLQSRLLRFRGNNAFQSLLLFDEAGTLLWSSADAKLAADPLMAAAIREAAAGSSIIRLGPYRDGDGRFHLDFIVPLAAEADNPHPVVVMHVDPLDHLFPTLQSWPVPSVSGETLLFRRDGHQVFCLGGQTVSAISDKRQIALTEKNLLAAQVLRGEAGPGRLIEGVDFRGVPVMGVARAIPETDWFLVAKLDKEEFSGKAYPGVFWIALTGMLALFMAVAGILIFRQRQELAATQRFSEIQGERLQALALLDSIAEGSRDAIFAKDAEGRYLLFNREAARVIGKTVEEVLGGDDRAIFPPDEAEMLMAIDRQVMAGNRTVTHEEKLTTVDGEVTFLVVKGPLHDAEGRVVGLFGISRDITERKKMEDSLRDSEARLHSTVTALTEGVIVCGPGGEVVSCNPSAERLLGRTAREMTSKAKGLADWQPIHEDGTPFRPAELPVSRALATGKPQRGVVLGDLGPDDRLTWLLVNAEPVHDAASGRLVAAVVSFTDITARKQADEALKESEEFKHAILDSMSAHIAVVNPDGIIVEVNEPWRRFALENGPEPGRAARRTGIGINYLDICRESSGASAEEAMAVLEGITGVLAGRLPSFSLEYPCHSPDRQRWFSMSVTRLGAGDKGVVIAHNDITARKGIEENLRESLAEKVALLKEVHHRVKNNLQIVASLLSLQANRVTDPKQADVLLDTRNRVRSIGLLHEVLYRSGNLAQLNFPAYVRELCSQLLRSFGQAAARIRVEESVAPVALPLEQAVPCGLIISELVSNSLKHAFPDGRAGRVTVALDHGEAGQLVLCVRDNGTGLAPGFNPAATATLGLQLVANLAGQLGGSLTIDSPAEGGAVFQVFFPGVSKENPLGGKF